MLLAAEQLGGAQQCLDLTLAYAAQRSQFGHAGSNEIQLNLIAERALGMPKAARSLSGFCRAGS